jgi:DNA-directed RNA polymerase sigma subunit (sigma70/sigma32)
MAAFEHRAPPTVLRGICRVTLPKRLQQILRNALSVLNPRERRIFEARRLSDDPITLEDLSTEFGVSRERVRQIEVRAFEKIQEAVKKNLDQIETSAEMTDTAEDHSGISG